MTAVKLEHILCTSTDFHNVLSRSSSERYWDTILGRQEAGQDDLCHFSCGTATKVDLAPGIQFAENKLYSIYCLKASVDLEFFTVYQDVCRGTSGAAVLLDVAHSVQQKADKMLCALPSPAAIKFFLRYLFF